VKGCNAQQVEEEANAEDAAEAPPAAKEVKSRECSRAEIY